MQKSTSNTKVQKRKETKGKNKKKALITEKNIAKEKRSSSRNPYQKLSTYEIQLCMNGTHKPTPIHDKVLYIVLVK